MVNFPTSAYLLFHDYLDPNLSVPNAKDNRLEGDDSVGIPNDNDWKYNLLNASDSDSYLSSLSQEVFQQVPSPPLQGRVTELSPVNISQWQSEMIPNYYIQKKRKIEWGDQQADSKRKARLEQNRVSAQAYRQQQSEVVNDLQRKINALKENLMQVCLQYHINYSLKLPPPVTEKETLVSEKSPPQWEEFIKTNKDLSNKEQLIEFRRAKNRYSAALSRARKKDYIDTLQQQKEFLESEIREIAQRTLSQTSKTFESLKKEDERLQQMYVLKKSWQRK